MSIIKSTPDILHVDLRVNPKNSNMGPQSMCSTMKIMDYARLDTRKNLVSRFEDAYIHTSTICYNVRVINIPL